MRDRLLDISDAKISINKDKLLGAGASGLVYVGRATWPAVNGRKRKSLQVAVKVFKTPNEKGDVTVPRWDEERHMFTGVPFKGNIQFSFPPYYYHAATNILANLREKYKRKQLPIVVPKQVLVEGVAGHVQEELRRPFIVSELYLKPGTPKHFLTGEKEYYYGTKFDRSKIQSKEDSLHRDGYYGLQRGMETIIDEYPELAEHAANVFFDLAEQGAPALADLFGVMQTKSGERKLILRDQDLLAKGIAQLEKGHHELYQDAFDDVYLYLSSLKKDEAKAKAKKYVERLKAMKLNEEVKAYAISKLKYHFS